MDKSPLKTLTLEEFLESERHKLTGKLTPVTPESFAEWKKQRLSKKAAEEQVRRRLAFQLYRTYFSWLRCTDWSRCRPAKPRRQQVVPCSKVETGVPISTTRSHPTTTTMRPRGTWRSFGRRRRPYGRSKKENVWAWATARCQMEICRMNQTQARLKKPPTLQMMRLVRRVPMALPRPLLPLEKMVDSWSTKHCWTEQAVFASRRPDPIRDAPLDKLQVQYRMDATRHGWRESRCTHCPREHISFSLYSRPNALEWRKFMYKHQSLRFNRLGRPHELQLGLGIARMKEYLA